MQITVFTVVRSAGVTWDIRAVPARPSKGSLVDFLCRFKPISTHTSPFYGAYLLGLE